MQATPDAGPFPLRIGLQRGQNYKAPKVPPLMLGIISSIFGAVGMEGRARITRNILPRCQSGLLFAIQNLIALMLIALQWSSSRLTKSDAPEVGFGRHKFNSYLSLAVATTPC
jgi:hypothetical protein